MERTILQQLEDAREVMHELISNDGTWQQRYQQEQVIVGLQRQLAAQQRDLELLTSIFA